MDRQEELAVGRRLFGHIDGRTTDLADELFRNKTVNYSCRERAALEMKRRDVRFGLVSVCAQGGMASAIVLERRS